MGEPRDSDDFPPLPTAWTWVCGPSTLSGPFGHVTGAVERGGGGKARIVVLHATRDGRRRPSHLLHEGYRIDDHLAPGILMLDAATLVAAFTGHGDDAELGVVRLRIDEGGIAEDGRTTVVLPATSTYAHVLDVGDPAGRLLIITRSIDWCPTGVWLDPQTLESSAPFQMVSPSPRATDHHRLPGRGGRPYIVTRQIPGGALVALVDDHPGAYRNGVVVAEISGGWWRRMDGTPLRAVDDPSAWDAFTVLDRVLSPGGEWVPWVHDIARDRSGATAVAWSERRHPVDEDAIAGLRYRVAEERGGSWFVHAPLHAGGPLYSAEPDYAGGISFAQADAIDRLWIVSSVDPLSGDGPAARRQLYSVWLSGHSPAASLLKQEHREDVMRPRVSTFGGPPGGPNATWFLAGGYRSYRDFETRPVVTVHGSNRAFDGIQPGA